MKNIIVYISLIKWTQNVKQMLKNTIKYLTKENKKKTLVYTLKSNQKKQNPSNCLKELVREHIR